MDNSYEPIVIDPVRLIDAYIGGHDWRKKENATSTYCIGALNNYLTGAVISGYWLDKIYPPEVSQAHKSCDFHLHDLGNLTAYCAGWSPRQFIEEGINGVPDKVNSAPPRHMSAAMQQLVNILGIMSNEWAGAQALNGFDTYLAPFIRMDKMDDKSIRQCIQAWLFNINQPSRWAGQAPFSNVTLDIFVPEDLKEQHPKIGGKVQPFTYGDLQAEVTQFDRIFLQEFEKGDSYGNAFQYPILTLNATRRFFEEIDPELSNDIWTLTAKHGIPYFSNYINSDMDPSELRSMCCRLRLDLRALTRKNGSLFGAGENTGSIGVVTLNLPKCGYLSHSEEELFQRIERVANIAAESLDIKRKQLAELLESGLYPYTKRYLTAGFANHFSTIGLVGMNEMCRNFFLNTKKKDRGIETKEGTELAIKVLNFLRDKCADYQEKYPDALFNLESTPAESTSYRLALHDKQKYPDIITAGTVQTPYYTNSSNLPVGFTSDPWEMLDHQQKLQTLYTGGTVAHIFADNNGVEPERVRDFVKKVMYETKIPYITWSPTLKVCNHGHGMFVADGSTVCPKCRDEAIAQYKKTLEQLEIKKNALLEKMTVEDQSH
jgi:ribonucleoside-triphosphate reductase